MSIDAAFSPLAFPALRNGNQDSIDSRARVSGHSAGYAAGLRAASADMAAHKAQLETEFDAAMKAGQARIEHTIGVLTAAIQTLNARTVPLVTTAQDAIAETAIELAEAIIGVELGRDDTAARSALLRALAHVDLALVHRVRLHPADLAVLDSQKLDALGVEFVADATLRSGDAVTEFENGYLDARVGTALDRARAAILEAGL